MRHHPLRRSLPFILSLVLLVTLLPVGLFAPLIGAAVPTGYTITDLGGQPGALTAFATDINDAGQVVGTVNWDH